MLNTDYPQVYATAIQEEDGSVANSDKVIGTVTFSNGAVVNADDKFYIKFSEGSGRSIPTLDGEYTVTGYAKNWGRGGI